MSPWSDFFSSMNETCAQSYDMAQMLSNANRIQAKGVH